MPSELTQVAHVAFPAQSAVANLYETPHLADAFAIQLPFGTSSDPEVLRRFVMSQQPSWIGWLSVVTVRRNERSFLGLDSAHDMVERSSGQRVILANQPCWLFQEKRTSMSVHPVRSNRLTA